MAGVVARELKQQSAFASGEQEILLGLLIASARIVEPWEKFLKATRRPDEQPIQRPAHSSRQPSDTAGVQRDRAAA